MWLSKLVAVGILVGVSTTCAAKSNTELAEFRRTLSADDVDLLEELVARDPHDLEARTQLIVHYFLNFGEKSVLPSRSAPQSNPWGIGLACFDHANCVCYHIALFCQSPEHLFHLIFADA